LSNFNIVNISTGMKQPRFTWLSIIY